MAEETGSNSGFFSDLFDAARGVFKEVVDFETRKLELTSLVNQKDFELTFLKSQSPKGVGSFTNPDAVGGFPLTTLLIVGGLVVGVIVIARKF